MEEFTRGAKQNDAVDAVRFKKIQQIEPGRSIDGDAGGAPWCDGRDDGSLNRRVHFVLMVRLQRSLNLGPRGAGR